MLPERATHRVRVGPQSRAQSTRSGDVFVAPWEADESASQVGLVAEAVRRANAYLDAGVDYVYPILLWETESLRRFMSEVRGPVNIVRPPQAPSLVELIALASPA